MDNRPSWLGCPRRAARILPLLTTNKTTKMPSLISWPAPSPVDQQRNVTYAEPSHRELWELSIRSGERAAGAPVSAQHALITWLRDQRILIWYCANWPCCHAWLSSPHYAPPSAASLRGPWLDYLLGMMGPVLPFPSAFLSYRPIPFGSSVACFDDQSWRPHGWIPVRMLLHRTLLREHCDSYMVRVHVLVAVYHPFQPHGERPSHEEG